jgi:membrane protein DedA with SNARE-associated domain
MLADLLLTLGQQPILLAVLLFAATFVVEDGATIAAGVMVAQTGIDPAVPLAAVVMGTAVGDIALYGLGRWGGSTAFGIKLRSRSDVVRAEQWIAGRALMMVFAARFLPGSRLPVFIASGLIAAPFVPVVAIIAVTTPFWTGGLFTMAWLAGEAGARDLLTAALPVGAALLTGALIIRRTNSALAGAQAA